MSSKLKYHLPSILLCIGIFIASSFPTDAYPKIEFELSDKIIHLVIYFILFFAFYYSLSNQDKFILLKKYSLIASLLFTAFYGATDEFHQYFVVGRECDFGDWVADFIGGLFGLIVLVIYNKFSKDKKNNPINITYDTTK